MDILECLAKQKIDSYAYAYAHRDMIICEDGLLSISDAVFEVKMRELGFCKDEVKEWLREPLEMRGIYMDQWERGVR